jgi:hypothetical protein
MGTPRTFHTATLLPNGKVLVTGGDDENFAVLSSAEVYDPQTQLFTPTANSMSTARAGHTATLLANGKVLVAGLGTADLYDPDTNSFTPTGGGGAMNVSREGHTATLLADGRVLLTGGRTGPSNATIVQMAELFDPTLNGGLGGFVFTGTTMNLPRANQTATLLPTGKVLIAGGLNTSGVRLQTTELFDPTAVGGLGNFTTSSPGGVMSTPRARHTATLLPDGTVLVAGGHTTTAPAELFDPTAVGGLGDFTDTGAMSTQRSQHTATLLANGQVLVTGGVNAVEINGLSSSELYTPILCSAAAPVADFTLTPTPGARTVVQGQSATYTIALTAQNGFASPVTLSVTGGLPAGASASFIPETVMPPGSVTLIVSTSGATPAATSTLTIQGAGGSQTAETSVDLTVTTPPGGAAPLAITPFTATVAGGSQITFGATGGTGPYTFSFVTNQSGGTVNASTGLYTAGATTGMDTVRVTDAVSATAEATVTVTAATGAVTVSLDGRALAALGSAQTLNVFATGGSAVLIGLTTDRVHDLKLPTGAYRLTAGAGSVSFTVNSITPTAQNPQCTGEVVLAP